MTPLIRDICNFVLTSCMYKVSYEGGKNSQSFTSCLFSPHQMPTFIYIGLTLAKSSSQEDFITYPTITTLLPIACLQCKTYKKKSHEYLQQKKVPKGVLIKKKVVIRE